MSLLKFDLLLVLELELEDFMCVLNGSGSDARTSVLPLCQPKDAVDLRWAAAVRLWWPTCSTLAES